MCIQNAFSLNIWCLLIHNTTIWKQWVVLNGNIDIIISGFGNTVNVVIK